MTTKEYLNQARHLDAHINCQLRELEYWRDLSAQVSGCNFEPHYSSSKSNTAPFVRCIEKIDEIEHKINQEIDALVDLKAEISSAIERLDDTEEKLLLKYRYFENRTWEEISGLLHVSERTVRRIHGRALQNFSVPNES